MPWSSRLSHSPVSLRLLGEEEEQHVHPLFGKMGPLFCLGSPAALAKQAAVTNFKQPSAKRAQAAVQRFQSLVNHGAATWHWMCPITSPPPAPVSTLKDPPAPCRQDPWPSTGLFSPSPGARRSPQQPSPKQCLTQQQSQQRTRCIRGPGTSRPTWLCRTVHGVAGAGLDSHRDCSHLAWPSAEHGWLKGRFCLKSSHCKHRAGGTFCASGRFPAPSRAAAQPAL